MLDKKHTIIIIAIICIVLFGFLYFFIKPRDEVVLTSSNVQALEPSNTTIAVTTSENISTTIIAYISGEVNNPDVYELENGSRIKDLVLKAGGFTNEADQNNINLSKKLTDEEHVHIYKLGEKQDIVIENQNNVNNQSSLVNINTATKQDLMTLPNIGDAVSNYIIDYRDTIGKFNTIEDIKNVDRIGDKTFEKIKDLITVD